jgi:hypothetical protein
MNIRIRTGMTFLAVAMILLIVACNSESNQNQPLTTTTNSGTSTAAPAKEVEQRKNALVRFVHALPSLAAVDLFANDTKITGDVRYKAVTSYSEIPTDNQTLRLRLSGQEGAEPVADEKKNFSAGKHYTVIAVPRNATAIFSKDTGQGAELRLIDDDLVAPANGKARVRVIDASPDLEKLDVFATGRSDVISQGVAFGEDSKYADVEPLNGTLEVRRAGENIATLTVPDVRFAAGRLYTIIVIGRTKGSAKLESIIVEDQFGATPTK